MQNSPIGFLCVTLSLSANALWAQGEPLSAIDWLSQPPTIEAPGAFNLFKPTTPLTASPRNEPAIANTVTVPSVETKVLGAPERSSVGLLDPGRTGLPAQLWQNSNAATLIERLDQIDLAVPAMARLMQVLMLAEAKGPYGDDIGFLAARLNRLVDMGAVESAQALLERAGIEDHALFPLWTELSLLGDRGTQMCRALSNQPNLANDIALKIYCTAQLGDWNRAALILRTSSILGDIAPRQARLMAQFLDQELAETQPIPMPPVRPSALEYRIYEALGEPLPSQRLPLAFASLDLSGDNGWKPQLEAAERLARASALPPNQLLGIYSLRQPAASGGIWDRVDAFQTFETTLSTGPDSRVATALEVLWPQMATAGLTVPFAELFADQLAGRDLNLRAKRMADRLMFLSPDYETLGPARAPDTVEGRFLSAIAHGTTPPEDIPPLPHAQAVAAAFASQPAPATLMQQAQQGEIGDVILQAMALFAIGADGKDRALSESLATFRALGLEDVARRAALEVMILDAERVRR